jgi:cholesterol transport system auxiliary component
VLNETDAGGKATQYLSGSLLEFGVDASASEAVVVYDAVRLVRGQTVEKKRFEARRSVSAVEPGPTGIALNAAANDVAVQVSDWIG